LCTKELTKKKDKEEKIICAVYFIFGYARIFGKKHS